jgi:chemotaxis protein CheX
MQRALFQAFEDAIEQTFQTMLGCKLQSLEMHSVDSGPVFHDVTGIIGLSGRAEGSCVLSLTREVALKIASTMLMMEANEIDADVIDAVGEITNMIAGVAKAKLEQYEMRIGLPNVVCGSGHSVNFPSSVVPICLPMGSEWGLLSLTVGLVVVEEPIVCEAC